MQNSYTNEAECADIAVGILQAYVEWVDVGEDLPQPQYTYLCSVRSEPI